MLRYTVKCDWIWLLFFVSMFCFYTITSIQYLAHLMIWIYCLYIFMRKNNGKIKKATLHNLVTICGGYGLLVLWALLSCLWAYGVMEGSATFNGMLKIFTIMACMVLYTDNFKKVETVLISYIDALALMSILILFTSPLSTYGTTDFGGVTHQFRNTIANAVFFGILLVLPLSHAFKKSSSIFYIALFLVTGLCTGSRRGIVQLVIIILFYAFTENNLNKKIKKLILFITFIILAGIILYNNPYFRETYWSRLFSIFDLSVDDLGGGEASTVGRNIYRMVAIDMFQMRPFTGFGIDGFHCFLADHPYTYTTFTLEAVYSHCNYTELLADFGLPGFVMYYSLHFNLIRKVRKKYKENKFFQIALIIMLATLVLDYGGISFQSNFAMYMYCILYLGIIYNSSSQNQKIAKPQ